MNIVLIGYRAVGKTTVGHLLAQALGWDFADCDARIEQRTGCSVSEIFRARGQDAFRALEHDALVDLARFDRLVVATGGGIVLDPRHPVLLRTMGEVVWLTADVDTLVARVGASDRPRLTTLPLRAEVLAHLAARNPVYTATASWTVDTSGRPARELALAILRMLQGAGKLDRTDALAQDIIENDCATHGGPSNELKRDRR